MPLPHRPEPLGALKARYQAALEPLYDWATIEEWQGELRPGLKRGHVFDFADGIRFIVSRELDDSKRTILHVSASIDAGSLLETIKAMPNPIGAFLAMAIDNFKKLGDRDLSREPVVITGAGVPHWVVVLEEPARAEQAS